MKNILNTSIFFLILLFHNLSHCQNNWKEITANGTHFAGIKSDGSLWAAGGNFIAGTAQDSGITLEKYYIVKQKDLSYGWKSISLGSVHCLAIKTDGTLWSWGNNTSGELGTGNNLSIMTPHRVGNDSDWKIISAGSSISYGIKQDGTLWAWGYNGNGLLGIGGISNTNVPVQIGSSNNWNYIDCKLNHMLAIKIDGTLWGCGTNTYGQLGNGSTSNVSIPTQIGSFNDWEIVSVGDQHSLGFRANGSLYAWGRNNFGQIGDGTNTNRNTPKLIISSINLISIAAGKANSNIIFSDGSRKAFGHNVFCAFGNGGSQPNSNVPILVNDGIVWSKIKSSGNLNLVVGIDENSYGKVWGTEGNLDFLSDGINVTPLDISCPSFGDGDCWEKCYAIGNSTSWNLSLDGTIYGPNVNSSGGFYGYLLNKFGNDNDWQLLSLKNNFCLALKNDHSLWAWGENGLGQLGIGSFFNSAIPTQIGTFIDWQTISAGGNHSLGILNDGTLWAWGANNSGQLGNGTNTNQNQPVQIGTENNWSQVSANSSYSLALKTDGTLWAWGLNDYGQLGIGNTINSNIPVQIGNQSDWSIISTCSRHSFGIKSNGTLWAWGRNNDGQLGIGNTLNSSIPVQVGNNGWQDINGGVGYSIGIQNDGTIWSWGNYMAALGYISTSDVLAPNQIGISDTWDKISCSGLNNSIPIAIQSNGVAYTWGTTLLGDGALRYRAEPHQIYCLQNDIPLLLKVLEFRINKDNQSNQLNFSTTYEMNFDHFEIEHSSNGRSFNKIGEVNSQIDCSEVCEYVFKDKSPGKGTNYYRLKIVDKDLSYSYSKIISTQNEFESLDYIFPNPGFDEIFISQGYENSIFTILNANGKFIKQDKMVHNKISIRELPSGIYYLHLNSDNSNNSYKFVKI